MSISMNRVVVILAAVLACMTYTWADAGVARADLGRSVKLTILVDKVMQPQAKWVSEEWMVKATAQAGFNVFSPRAGHDRLDEVRQVTEWCAQAGIYHMPWMRGTLTAPGGPEAAGKRVVWASGNEQPLWSPNSDEFWEWTHRYIVEYAKISAENKHLMGIFLDYENYARGKEGNLYSLSYDDVILAKFAAAQGIDLPKLALDTRKAWLDKQGLHEAFSKFQIDHWRERCRTLRKAVDAFDPTFQFCIYPAPGTLFMVEATYPEWATEQAPLILADASTYGRPSRFLPQAEALESNRQKLVERMAIPKDAGIPFIYAGGIDPLVRGADPEFSGKNAVMISEVTDGYWIFYEGPTYTKQDHADYWKWFTWANAAIHEGRFDAQHEARETPEDWTLDVFGGKDQALSLAGPEVSGEKVEFPVVKMRGDNLLLVAVEAGMPVEVNLQNHPVARYESLLMWDLRDVKLNKVASGTIPHGEQGTVRFVAETDGLYLLGASAGSCAYSVASTNAPIGLFAGDGLGLIYGSKRLYFAVPEGLDEFTLTAHGAHAETVRVNVFGPEGDQIATGQTSPKKKEVAVQVTAGGQDAATWSLELTKADEGVLEDNTITLGPGLAPALALDPRHVFSVSR